MNGGWTRSTNRYNKESLSGPDDHDDFDDILLWLKSTKPENTKLIKKKLRSYPKLFNKWDEISQEFQRQSVKLTGKFDPDTYWGRKAKKYNQIEKEFKLLEQELYEIGSIATKFLDKKYKM